MKHLLILAISCVCATISQAKMVFGVECIYQDTLDVAMTLDSAYLHYSESAKSTHFEGYTIQVFSGDRNGANSVRANIISLEIESATRMIYREPNFKIHIGSFPDVGSAERALVQWQMHYPDAFVLKTQVPWYELPTQDDVAPSDTVNIEQ